MKFILVFMFILISGCTHNSEFENFGKLHSVVGNYDSYATYIQFNKEYAITAKHVDNIKNGIKCSTGCDLVFFKKNANNFNQTIKWRDPIVGEKIIITGNSVSNRIVKKEGIVLKDIITPDKESKFYYFLNSANSLDGMSGGPVFAKSDGAIVGMTIGALNYDFNGLQKQTSIFIPYHLIIKEFNLIK